MKKIKFFNITLGELDLNQVEKRISAFMSENEKSEYAVIIGSDSQKAGKNKYEFVSAIIVHRIGSGAIYFWRRDRIERKMSLKERIYQEAVMSLETSENLLEAFRKNGIARYNIQIHLDVGEKGKSRELISEITAFIKGSGYDVKIKPESVGASKVADKHT